MITPLEFFGGATEATISSAITLDLRARIWRVKTSTAGLDLFWPPRTFPGLPLGGPVFILINYGTSGAGNVSFDIRETEVANPFAVPLGRGVIAGTYLLNGVIRWAWQPISTLFYTTY